MVALAVLLQFLSSNYARVDLAVDLDSWVQIDDPDDVL